MFLFVLTYWRQIIVAALSFGIGFTAGYNIGFFFGERAGRSEVKTEYITKTLEVREEHAKIRNHRPDDAALIKRLRSGTF